MRIGLTYDLRAEYLAAGFTEDETAEFDRPDTVAALEGTLRELGHQTDRIGHARQLVSRLAAGDEWDLVVNIAEGLSGIAREAQVPAILDAYGIAYTFSDPLVMALTLHKGLTKTVVRDSGVPTAPFRTVQQLSDVVGMSLPFPLFVKPVAEGTGKGITPKSICRNQRELEAACRELLTTYEQPVLGETFLPGLEFTVGLVGSGEQAEVVATLEIILRSEAEPDVYSYVNKERCEELVEYRLASAADDDQVREAERVALAAWRVLNCRDAGRIDLRCNADGQPLFLEVNPLAGLHPEHSDLPILATKAGWTYRELIARIVKSAEPRVAEAANSKPRRFGRGLKRQ